MHLQYIKLCVKTWPSIIIKKTQKTKNTCLYVISAVLSTKRNTDYYFLTLVSFLCILLINETFRIASTYLMVNNKVITSFSPINLKINVTEQSTNIQVKNCNVVCTLENKNKKPGDNKVRSDTCCLHTSFVWNKFFSEKFFCCVKCRTRCDPHKRLYCIQGGKISAQKSWYCIETKQIRINNYLHDNAFQQHCARLIFLMEN